MSFDEVVYDLQAAASALGTFISLWGFIQFAPCLWKVVMGKELDANHQACPRHAFLAMVCVAVIVFAFARMNTLGILDLGSTVAGLSYILGMLIMVMTVGLGVWAADGSHLPKQATTWRSTGREFNPTQLTKIIRMLLIVTLAFSAVGLLRLGQ
jgi:hypothetical protein